MAFSPGTALRESRGCGQCVPLSLDHHDRPPSVLLVRPMVPQEANRHHFIESKANRDHFHPAIISSLDQAQCASATRIDVDSSSQVPLTSNRRARLCSSKWGFKEKSQCEPLVRTLRSLTRSNRQCRMPRHANRPWHSHFVPCSRQRLGVSWVPATLPFSAEASQQMAIEVGWRTKIACFSRPASGTGAGESQRALFVSRMPVKLSLAARFPHYTV